MRRTVLITALLALLSGLFVSGAWAQEGTPIPTPLSPQWTPRFTATPQRYALRIAHTGIVAGMGFTSIGVGGMAIDSDGALYVGDGGQTVIVLAPDLSEKARFTVQQPYALAFARLPSGGTGDLLIGQRNQAQISRYSRAGERLGLLWAQPNGQLETFAAAPDGSVYIVWNATSGPVLTALTRLDARGNILWNVPLGTPRQQTDAVHGLTFERDGTINLTLTGYDFTDPFRAAFLVYSADGQINRKRPVLPALRGLIAPAPLTRLEGGGLVVFSTEFVTWYGVDNTLLAQVFSNDVRAGGVPVNRYERRAMIAPRPDGRSVVVAEIRDDGRLGVGVIELIDRLSAASSN